jgi:hypothetical protein
MFLDVSLKLIELFVEFPIKLYRIDFKQNINPFLALFIEKMKGRELTYSLRLRGTRGIRPTATPHNCPFIIIAVFSANLTKKESVYLMDSFANGSICNAVPYHNRIAEGHSLGSPFGKVP